MKAKRTIRNAVPLSLALMLALGLLAACGTPDPPADGTPSGTTEGIPPSAATSPEKTNAEDTAEETTAAETQPETEAHVHAFDEWITVREATCETIGKQERACACGETEEQKLKKTGHTPVAILTVEPTLTENGSTGGRGGHGAFRVYGELRDYSSLRKGKEIK